MHEPERCDGCRRFTWAALTDGLCVDCQAKTHTPATAPVRVIKPRQSREQTRLVQRAYERRKAADFRAELVVDTYRPVPAPNRCYYCGMEMRGTLTWDPWHHPAHPGCYASNMTRGR